MQELNKMIELLLSAPTPKFWGIIVLLTLALIVFATTIIGANT